MSGSGSPAVMWSKSDCVKNENPAGCCSLPSVDSFVFFPHRALDISSVSSSLSIINSRLSVSFHPFVLFKAAFRTLTHLVFPPCFLFVSSHLTSIFSFLFFPPLIHSSVIAPPLSQEVQICAIFIWREYVQISSALRWHLQTVLFCFLNHAGGWSKCPQWVRRKSSGIFCMLSH